MVKKVSGSIPTRPTGSTSGVKENQKVEGTQVENVQKVGSVQAQGRVEKIRRQTRPMTPEERDHLMQLVDEEALKLFGDGKMPESRRESLTRGVKLTLAAGLIEIDDDEGKK